jgi:hypothetical protein
MHGRLVWSERKRRENLRKHGLDFIDASKVLRGATVSYEDDRTGYGEQRFVTLGLLRDLPVSLVLAYTDADTRVISFRKATRREEEIYFQSIAY